MGSYARDVYELCLCMISDPHNYEHPLFQNQQEYQISRVMLDTGDDQNQSSAVLYFRHKKTDQTKKYRFTDITLTQYCGAFTGLRGYLPVYVATLAGRGWESEKIEIGDTDPGGVWFWAEKMEEVS